MFPGPLGLSLSGKALERGDWGYDAINIRDFAEGVHKTVDDTPYGGGAGMVMRPDVIDAALAAVEEAPGPVIYLSPRGRPLDQRRVRALARAPGATLLCGRYEGVDQRVLEARAVEEVLRGARVPGPGRHAALAQHELLHPAGGRLGQALQDLDARCREDAGEDAAVLQEHGALLGARHGELFLKQRPIFQETSKRHLGGRKRASRTGQASFRNR